MCLNDLTHDLDELQKFVLLFADDTLLLSETLHDLHVLLNKPSAYCAKWNLTVNTNKTKIVIFKRSSRPEDVEFFYEKVKLDVVKKIIYLGVNVTSYGNFSQAKSISRNKDRKLCTF